MSKTYNRSTYLFDKSHEYHLFFILRQGPILPGLTTNGRRVCILRGVSKDIVTPNIDDCMKLVLMAGDIRLKEEQVGVAGDVYIFGKKPRKT